MTGRERPRQPTIRSGNKKVPLTYYRSSSSATQAASSPFKRREVKAGRGRIFIVRTIDLLVIAAIIFGIGYSLIVKPEPVVKLNDSSYHPANVYASLAAKLLSSPKNRTKMSLDEASIIDPLKQRFPEISNASIELPLAGQRPILRITVAKPALMLTGNDQSYVIDSEGIAVAPSSQLPDVKNLPLVDDQTGFDIKAGQPALSVSAVKFIDVLLAECKRNQVPVKSMTLPVSPLELDLRTADKTYFVKFYLDGNALVETGQFMAARHQFAHGGGPSQYLDVRVEGKVFYK